jgi:hypothetical protein
MQKKIALLVSASALATTALTALGCSSNPGPQPLGASAGCQQLGDPSAATASILSPASVYGARKAEPTQFTSRGVSRGTDLYIHATPGSSSEYLERTLICHAVYGRPLHQSDPLHPSSGPVANVEVRSIGAGYAVRVSGFDYDTNEEIWQRATNLAPTTTGVEQVASARPRTTH